MSEYPVVSPFYFPVLSSCSRLRVAFGEASPERFAQRRAGSVRRQRCNEREHEQRRKNIEL
jgi:hypothetical protein